ncbi:MAG: 2-hydroxyacyl-CoA dehydratase [Dehalococcoidales bacterium]|nr:2-hydroxyacyl-CoA dehydratase [Dehalococcoidales bacterium]
MNVNEMSNGQEQMPRSYKQLRSSIAVKAYQKEWFMKIREKAKEGIPYGICNADECEEIFTAFGMPAIVTQWWIGIIAAKRMSTHYSSILAEKDWDMNHYDGSLGLAVALEDDPLIAPWGGLPKQAIIIGSTIGDPCLTLKEIWAREIGCPCFPLEIVAPINTPLPPRWWEKIRDHWDEIIDPKSLDFRVEQYKELIKFIELTTGLRFSLSRLNEVNSLINEMEDYFKAARDLIAKTVPCPVTLSDQLSSYTPIQWHRGTPEARDFAKMFYEEVKERVDTGQAAYPKEKIRLMWLSVGLWTNTAFYQYFEEKYGATFVASMYLSLGADCYARNVHNNDPLRAIAGRNIFLGIENNEFLVKEAKLHKCNGAVRFKDRGDSPSLQTLAFEKAGIPVCEIPGSNVDLRQWRDEEVKFTLSQFIEKRLLS